MKIYFERTSGNNNIIFVAGETAKVCDFAPSGKMDGVDLYTENAPKKLREYFLENEINDFSPLSGDEIQLKEIIDILETTELVYKGR